MCHLCSEAVLPKSSALLLTNSLLCFSFVCVVYVPVRMCRCAHGDHRRVSFCLTLCHIPLRHSLLLNAGGGRQHYQPTSPSHPPVSIPQPALGLQAHAAFSAGTRYQSSAPHACATPLNHLPSPYFILSHSIYYRVTHCRPHCHLNRFFIFGT